MPYLIRKTKRLVLRPLGPADYPAWREAHSKMLPPRNCWDRVNLSPSEVSPSAFRKVLRTQKKLRAEDSFFHLAIFEKASGRQIGISALMNLVRGLGQTAFLGYFIYNRHWDRGFGKEATRATIDIGFRDLKLHRIEAGGRTPQSPINFTGAIARPAQGGPKKTMRLLKKKMGGLNDLQRDV